MRRRLFYSVTVWSPSHFAPLWEGSPNLALLPLEGFDPEASGCLLLKAFSWCCSSAWGPFHAWLLTGSSPEIPQCNCMLFQGIVCLVSVLTPCHSGNALRILVGACCTENSSWHPGGAGLPSGPLEGGFLPSACLSVSKFMEGAHKHNLQLAVTSVIS